MQFGITALATQHAMRDGRVWLATDAGTEGCEVLMGEK